MLARAARSLFGAIFILGLSIPLWAVETFTVSVYELKVYSSPSVNSPVLTILTQGQKVQAGSNPAGGFKKVLIIDKMGKKKIGYVVVGDYSTPSTPSMERPYTRRSVKGGHNRLAIALEGGISYQSTSDKAISDPSGLPGQTDSLSYFSPEFGGGLFIPISPQFVVHAYLLYQVININTNFSLQSFGIPTPMTIQSTYLDGGVVARFYPNPRSEFWLGGGVQLNYGISSSANYLNSNFNLSNNQLAYIFAALGYDLSFNEKLFLAPEIRIGAIPNISPLIYGGDIIVSLGYRL